MLFDNSQVIGDVDEMAALLAGTVLEPCPVEEIDGNVFTIEIGGLDVETAWRAARQVLPQTGRWPVATTREMDVGDVAQAELARLDELARRIDPWPYFPRWTSDPGDVVSRAEAAGTFQAWLRTDLSQHLAARLPETTTRSEADRIVYDLLVIEPHLTAPVQGHLDYLRGTRNWFVPGDVDLLLLPTASPWLAPAWLSYFGALSPQGVESLIAALWQWHRHHDAEIVASWGTMMQFAVGRPPAPGDQAWTLARQINAVGGSLQDPAWLLAFALPSSNHWFLHDRP